MKRNQIFKEIKAGKSKQELYDGLVEQNQPREKAVKILNGLPSHKNYKKFKSLNLTLAILLTLLTVTMLNYGQYASAVYFGLTAYLAFDYKIKYYYWITILSGLGLIGLIIPVVNGSDIQLANARVILSSSSIIFSFILSIFLFKKLTVRPNEKRVIYENEHGQSRSYIDYQFDD